jgi:hypothetical protein
MYKDVEMEELLDESELGQETKPPENKVLDVQRFESKAHPADEV